MPSSARRRWRTRLSKLDIDHSARRTTRCSYHVLTGWERYSQRVTVLGLLVMKSRPGAQVRAGVGYLRHGRSGRDRGLLCVQQEAFEHQQEPEQA